MRRDGSLHSKRLFFYISVTTLTDRVLRLLKCPKAQNIWMTFTLFSFCVTLFLSVNNSFPFVWHKLCFGRILAFEESFKKIKNNLHNVKVPWFFVDAKWLNQELHFINAYLTCNSIFYASSVACFSEFFKMNLRNAEFFKELRNGNNRLVAHMLKRKDVKPDIRDLEYPTRPTPLIIATEQNNETLVEILLRYKPDVDLEDKSGKRPVW